MYVCVEGMMNGWTREDTNQLSSDLREERERERRRKKKIYYYYYYCGEGKDK